MIMSFCTINFPSHTMTTMNTAPKTRQIDDKSHFVLSIETKDLSQTVSRLMLEGIQFTLYYYPASEEKKGSVDFRSESLFTEPVSKSKPDKKQMFMELMDQTIREHILAGTTPLIEDLAKASAMNCSVVKAKFRELTDKTFYQYYVLKKMDYAAELLKAGHKATKVSEKIGYRHPIKFNKMFQKYFGVTPHQYRKKYESEMA